MIIPKKIFMTKGVGRHRDLLQSFELALRNAGIEKCNLVMVSSIFPPGAEIISKDEGVKLLQPGQITFCVMSRNASDENNRLISSSVGLAIPADKSTYGYISENHAFGQTDEKCGECAEDIAASMLASTQGIEFNVNDSWNEHEKVFKISGKIIKTTNITQSAICKNGEWTTVIAVAVMLE